MAQADVLSFVETFTDGQANPTTIARYYSEIVQNLAAMPQLWTPNVAANMTPTADGVYTLPPDAVSIIGGTYGGLWLDTLTVTAAETLDPYWRTHVGDPAALVYFVESVMSFRLYPQPEVTTPTQQLDVYYVGTLVDLPPWYNLILAFGVMAHDLRHESVYKDEMLAKFCDQLYKTFLRWAS